MRPRRGRDAPRDGVALTLVWVVPLSVIAVGLVLVAVYASRAAEEADHLRAEVRNLGALGPALAEVRTAAEALRESLEWLRRP